MTPGAIARRYGKALFELAVQGDSVEDVGAGLAEVAAAVESLDAGTLASGTLAPDQREQLSAALVACVGKDSLLGRFLGVVATNDRLEELPAVREQYEKLQDVAAGRVRVRMRSATALGDADHGTLRSTFEKITGRKVLDTVEVDADLLGGVTVEAEGRVYDGSVRTQLARLERVMAGRTGQAG